MEKKAGQSWGIYGRECTKCHVCFSWDNFNKSKKGINGKYSYCKGCHRATSNARTRTQREKNKNRDPYGEEAQKEYGPTKRCSICFHYWPRTREYFWTDPSSKDGLYYTDRICARLRYSKIDATIDEVLETFEKQNHKCANSFCRVVFKGIWGQGQTKSSPVLEHDHKTGKLRGIYCFGCNNGGMEYWDRPPEIIAGEYLHFKSIHPDRAAQFVSVLTSLTKQHISA